ncbi:MAG: hypothetical protein QXL94_02185 [Candidatus Parvarchaeum sp.]
MKLDIALKNKEVVKEASIKFKSRFKKIDEGVYKALEIDWQGIHFKSIAVFFSKNKKHIRVSVVMGDNIDLNQSTVISLERALAVIIKKCYNDLRGNVVENKLVEQTLKEIFTYELVGEE